MIFSTTVKEMNDLLELCHLLNGNITRRNIRQLREELVNKILKEGVYLVEKDEFAEAVYGQVLYKVK